MIRYQLPLALVLFAANPGIAAELTVETDKENVVASRLEGGWHLHNDLTKRLTGDAEPQPGELPFRGQMRFDSDQSVAGKVPGKYARVLTERKMKIYMAGYITSAGKAYPFVLTNIHGNPHVLFWLERDGDPFGNVESFNIMLTVAKDKQNDLLFVGGDFNNQPFSAFERADLRSTK